MEFKLLPVLVVICAYLVGSVPFGYLVAKSKGVDILNFGSGNIGATNVYRALGRGLGLLVFFLDVMKGLLPAAAGIFLFHSQLWSFGIGMAAVAGHCLSPFLKFKGGKGIATGLGAMLGSVPLVALSAFGVFLIVMVFTRYVSLSSIAAALTIVPFGYVFGVPNALLWSFGILAIFIIYKHRANIRRLRNGTESKFAFKPKENSEGAKALVTLLIVVCSCLAASSTYIPSK